jgi:hypothetical protein
MQLPTAPQAALSPSAASIRLMLCPNHLLAGAGAVLLFVHWVQRAYKKGVRGVLRDYKVLGGKWNVDVSTIKCRQAPPQPA